MLCAKSLSLSWRVYSYPPSSNAFSRTAWNFRLKFETCWSKFLKNILTHSRLKPEVSVIWQNFNFWVVHHFLNFLLYLFIHLIVCSVLNSSNYFSFIFLHITKSIFCKKHLTKTKYFLYENKSTMINMCNIWNLLLWSKYFRTFWYFTEYFFGHK